MKQQTDVTVILDRSGSMEGIKSDVIGGFNQFLATQKREPGACVLTLVQFDNQYDIVYSACDIQDAPPLTAESFEPRGTTALLDAIGRTIMGAGARFDALPESERPDRVLVVIITDGQENASVEHSRERIHEMIATQRDVYRWTFLFLAANQDAIAEGGTVGVGPQHSLTWAATSQGVPIVASRLSSAVASFRATGDARLDEPEPKGNRKKVH